jgi:2-amino-4-hydroxy-6-hydroxymethyldihydropteridine diphosphokinase
MEKKIAFLGLGSNIGDKYKHLLDAILLLEEYKVIKVIKKSSFYETAPIGYTKQDSFINMVIKIETNLVPQELLKTVNEVEATLLRKRVIRWGPRTIDIDILFYDNLKINEIDLIIPHPRISERKFVIVPLLEIDSDMMIDGKNLKVFLNGIEDQLIRKVEYGE